MDIFTNDFINVQGRKQAKEHIISRYGDFGWQLVGQKDDRLYCDITHLSFTRPHFIENKDELQLMQVRLEVAFNKMGKYTRKITSRAVTAGNCFSLLAILSAVGGVLLFILGSGYLSLVFGSLLVVLGVALGVTGGFVGYRLYKSDKKRYTALINAQAAYIKRLCAAARRLRGADEQ